MDTWTFLLAMVAGAIGAYYYFLHKLRYFKDISVPHIPPIPLFGNLGPMMFRQKSIAELIEDVYKVDSNAKYVGMYDFTTPLVVIRDLELIKSVTVKNFEHFMDHRNFVDVATEPLLGKNLFSLCGDRWKEARNLLSPAFTSSKLKAMFKLMSECGATFADYWATAPAETRNCVDIKDAATRYTNDVIATCAFGIKVDSLRDRDNDFYVLGRGTQFDTVRTLKFFFSRNFPRLYRLLRIRMFKPEVSSFFMDVVKTTVRTRDEKGIVRPDMIQLMMETRGSEKGVELSIEDMTGHAFVFFFGGFDSVASLMCFAAHQMAVYPDVQKKLHEEIDATMEETKGDLTYEAVQKMKYLDAVLHETLRLYPILSFLDRVCVKDFELPPALPGLKPVTMKKGSMLWVPVYGLHMDPQYFSDPKKFNPERFLEKNKDSLNLSAYMAFGSGPRVCIGNRLALMEAKVMFIHLLARCELLPCEKTPIPMVLKKGSVQVGSEGGFWLKIEPRSSKNPKNLTNGHAAA